MTDRIVILASARKRGYDDADLLHVMAFAVREFHQDDGMVMYVGADRAGRLMEVGTIRLRSGATAIAHALRPPSQRYQQYIVRKQRHKETR